MICDLQVVLRSLNVDRDPSSYISYVEKMSRSNYNIIRLLGEGGFSKTHLVTRKSGDRREICLKETQLSSEFVLFILSLVYNSFSDNPTNRKKNELAHNEVTIHAQLNSPFIIRMYNHFEESSTIYLELEYASNDTLASLIERKKHNSDYFDEPTVWKFLTELTLAVQCFQCFSFLCVLNSLAVIP